MVLDSDSPTDFVQRVMATQSVTDAQAEVVDQLNADKSVLAARQQQMQVTEEAIEATEAEAENAGRASSQGSPTMAAQRQE